MLLKGLLSAGAPYYVRPMQKLALLTAACVAALGLGTASASAKAPPKGKYDCTIGGSTLFGTLTIKAHGHYKHRGTKGRYVAKGGSVKFPDGITGYRISFKGGSLKGMKGRWYKSNDGTASGNYEIALRNPTDDFESIYCDRRK
jgi:hypothetical protein